MNMFSMCNYTNDVVQYSISMHRDYRLQTAPIPPPKIYQQQPQDKLTRDTIQIISYLSIMLNTVEVDLPFKIENINDGRENICKSGQKRRQGENRRNVGDIIEEFRKQRQQQWQESYQQHTLKPADKINRSPISHLSSHSSHSNTNVTNIKAQFGENINNPISSNLQPNPKPLKAHKNTPKQKQKHKQYQQQISTKTHQYRHQQSTVTFSPLRIDISLPSLCSEDLDELKEQKMIIYEIQNDIKLLIRKIQANHIDRDEEPARPNVNVKIKTGKKKMGAGIGK